ncbi:PAAR domain-containing protein [Hafnia paralvei]|uniref:PAAR domain-containing protein n=1 Tax=Hafnia paralvei TaxID=546367 RepID=A0A4Q9ETI8_9GAMM|nr:PAAR domain-containing protein [Hafnia paralvei]TBM29553.1 PAAR domain-containing protein [Hafnia paralvei]
MMKKVVVIGDPISHGGSVISASSSIDISGKRAALFGDTVNCAKHGTNRIKQCDMSYDEEGKGIVVDGCQTECGAQVIATLSDMEIE